MPLSISSLRRCEYRSFPAASWFLRPGAALFFVDNYMRRDFCARRAWIDGNPSACIRRIGATAQLEDGCQIPRVSHTAAHPRTPGNHPMVKLSSSDLTGK